MLTVLVGREQPQATNETNMHGSGLMLSKLASLSLAQRVKALKCEISTIQAKSKQPLTHRCLDSVLSQEKHPAVDSECPSVARCWTPCVDRPVGMQTYIEGSLLDPDAVPKPPVAPLCLPERVLPFIWFIWIPARETSNELGELFHYLTRLLINLGLYSFPLWRWLLSINLPVCFEGFRCTCLQSLIITAGNRWQTKDRNKNNRRVFMRRSVMMYSGTNINTSGPA